MKKKTDKHLHIISFDIPYPANYGGIIDVFYKAKALSDYGINVHLHCFTTDTKQKIDLKKLFYSVHYYSCNTSYKLFFKKSPFIVNMRKSENLILTLLKDQHPILMEGLHTTALLWDKRLEKRLKIVRTHNIEHEYYHCLSKIEKRLKTKIYFFIESIRLKYYENLLSKADSLLCISETDYNYFQNKYKTAIYLPAFHPHSHANSLEGKGNYVLYHGNLSIPENINAVSKLIQQVFNNSTIQFKIAGFNPPKYLLKMVESKSNIHILSNPNDDELTQLIKYAHINILITDQATGLKLKLLNALYNGRFVLANEKMVSGSHLENLCEIVNDLGEMKSAIVDLMDKTFTSYMIENRKCHLQNLYQKEKHILKILTLLK